MPTRIRKALPWAGLFVASFATFAALRIHQDSQHAPQLAMAQTLVAQSIQPDSTAQSTEPVQQLADEQDSIERDRQEDPTDLSDLAADDDPSTREEAQALMQALAENPD